MSRSGFTPEGGGGFLRVCCGNHCLSIERSGWNRRARRELSNVALREVLEVLSSAVSGLHVRTTEGVTTIRITFYHDQNARNGVSIPTKQSAVTIVHAAERWDLFVRSGKGSSGNPFDCGNPTSPRFPGSVPGGMLARARVVEVKDATKLKKLLTEREG